MSETTTLELRNEFGRYTVELQKQEMNIGDVFEDLVMPVLLAAGYSQTVIESYLGDGTE